MAKFPQETVSVKPFVAWLTEAYKNKWGYIMAAYCQDPKKLSSWYFTGQYSGLQRVKALYWKKYSPKVTDCAGLLEGYLTETLGYTVNERARNQYSSWCTIKGRIGTIQKKAGTAVFMMNSGTTTAHHVGYLVCPVDRNKPNGDWWVVEARGVLYGVKKYKLSGRRWSHWGLADKFLSYDCSPSEAYDIAFNGAPTTGTDKALYRGVDAKAEVIRLQLRLLKLGYKLPKWGADGDYGSRDRSRCKGLPEGHRAYRRWCKREPLPLPHFTNRQRGEPPNKPLIG